MTEAVKENLRELIRGALKVKYLSESCQDAVLTGNHYQSIVLGDERTTGFRTRRDEFLDQINFEGKKVLDLGSNLGELSRAARERGARLVDGVEYDPYFIEIAELVNAYNDVTRVSFYQRDITDPSIYGERYDVVMAFSVFIYAEKVLDRIAEITDVLVLETHKLVGNLEKTYIGPTSEYFPSYRVLGETEWGTQHDPDITRAVVVFAKDDETLAQALRDVPMPELPTKETLPTRPAVPEERMQATAHAIGGTMAAEYLEIDMARTCLQERFFQHFEFSSPQELLDAIASTEIDLDAIVKSRDSRVSNYRGWVYWFLFVKGYLQYLETGAVGRGNVYVDYLMRYFGPRQHDPGLTPLLADLLLTIERTAQRFRDFDHYRRLDAGEDTGIYAPAPIRLVAEDPPRSALLTVWQTGSERPIKVRRLDGWHRLFVAKLYRVETLGAEAVYEAERPGPMRGAIEHASYDGTMLLIRGWCLHPERRPELIEARVEGRMVGTSTLQHRPDVKEAFPDVPHADQSGFAIEAECALPSAERLDVELIALGDWLAFGAMHVPVLPEAALEREWPPAALAERVAGTSDPNRLALTAARSAQGLVGPLADAGPLGSFHSVLDWGCGLGLVEVFLGRLLPAAEVMGVDFDEESVAWCRSALPGRFETVERRPPTSLADGSFDLVVGRAMLPRLTGEEQAAWLAELHRLLRPDGYAALSLRGELVRPLLARDLREELASAGIAERGGVTYQTRDYTERAVASAFDVVTYIEGGVDDHEDLIVLRRR